MITYGRSDIIIRDRRAFAAWPPLQPERLETILTAALDRREEHAERRREHIADLNKRAAESELRLKRLYDAIEAGVADLDDPR
jgi:hypothetical protein